MLTVEHIIATQKDQAASFYELANKTVASVERLAELNIKTMKSAVADSAAHTEALLSVKDVQGLVALGNSDLKSAAEKATAYSRELYEIASGISSEISKVAEARTADAQKQFGAIVDSAVKSAPKGSEPAVAAMQNAVSTASSAIESMQKAIKQASEQAAANINTMATQAMNAAVEPVKAKKTTA